MELRDHQKKCVNFITQDQNRGLILYHGLGTGKTFTSISMFEALYNIDNSLKAVVVVPAKLIANYEKEIENAKVQSPKSYSIFSYDGFAKTDEENNSDDDNDNSDGSPANVPKTRDKRTQKRESNWLAVLNQSVEQKKKKIQKKETLDFIHNNAGSYVLILDEAHLLRNSASKKTDFILKFANKCKKVIILTGTPFVNYANDIAVLYNMIETDKKKN